MKKLLFVFVLAAIIAAGTAFADHPDGWGVGVQGGWSGGIGGALTLKFPSVPVFWAVDLGGFGGTLWVQLAGDYYFIDSQLIPTLHWYVGGGVYVNLALGDNLGLAVGARIPIGLSWQPIPLLEIYLQAVPSIGLSIFPEMGLYPNFFGANLGIRLWF